MDHNKYMTTGEFARRMGVTKNTLFQYRFIFTGNCGYQRLPLLFHLPDGSI